MGFGDKVSKATIREKIGRDLTGRDDYVSRSLNLVEEPLDIAAHTYSTLTFEIMDIRESDGWQSPDHTAAMSSPSDSARFQILNDGTNDVHAMKYIEGGRRLFYVGWTGNVDRRSGNNKSYNTHWFEITHGVNQLGFIPIAGDEIAENATASSWYRERHLMPFGYSAFQHLNPGDSIGPMIRRIGSGGPVDFALDGNFVVRSVRPKHA